MAISIAETLACSLLASFVIASAFASAEVPFIVAHKKATLARVRPGTERVTVSIDVYNQGSAPAYDVSLTDSSWPQDMFNIVSGNTSKSWERLDGGAVLSHSFELESTVKVLYNGAPAIITFRIPTKAALQEAYSTPIMPLDVLADRPPEKKYEWAKRLLVKYGSQVSVLTLVVLFVYLIASPSKSGSGRGSKKKR